MTRSELIARLAQRFPQLLPRDAETAVTVILEAIEDALVSGSRVEVRGFGSFSVNYRPPRQARNPKSGEAVEVAGKRTPHFKAGKALRDAIADQAED